MTPPALLRHLRWILPVVVFLALLGFTVIWWAETSRGELPVLGEVPVFEMTERSGELFGREDLIDRISVFNFIFTNCESICPITCDHMASLYRSFAGTDKVRFVSVSVDPDRDSLYALRQFAESWGVNDDRWVFLRAPVEDVVALCEEGFMLPVGDLPMGHTVRFILVDDRGRIRGYYDGLDPLSSVRLITDHIRSIAQEQ